MEEFQAGLEKDGPIVLAGRIAALEAANATLIEEAATRGEALAAETVRADRAEADRDDALALVAKAEQAAEAAAAGERAARAAVTRIAAPVKPRRLGMLAEDKALTGAALRAAIAGAEAVEIAFSDGRLELAGIDPVRVSGAAWREHGFGLLLAMPVELVGPGGGAGVAIDGYALLLDGRQVAYARRSVPLPLFAGQRVNIEGDIIF